MMSKSNVWAALLGCVISSIIFGLIILKTDKAQGINPRSLELRDSVYLELYAESQVLRSELEQMKEDKKITDSLYGPLIQNAEAISERLKAKPLRIEDLSEEAKDSILKKSLEGVQIIP